MLICHLPFSLQPLGHSRWDSHTPHRFRGGSAEAPRASPVLLSLLQPIWPRPPFSFPPWLHMPPISDPSCRRIADWNAHQFWRLATSGIYQQQKLSGETHKAYGASNTLPSQSPSSASPCPSWPVIGWSLVCGPNEPSPHLFIVLEQWQFCAQMVQDG